MPLHLKRSLHERLSDRKFREAFISSRIGQLIATQIRVFRQEKEMSQDELARLLGTSQNAVYRLENPKYGKYSISTLKKIASVFDVGLIVRFAPFSEIADWSINMSGQSIKVPPFDHDSGFIPRKEPASEDAYDAVPAEADGTDGTFRFWPVHPTGKESRDRHETGKMVSIYPPTTAQALLKQSPGDQPYV